MLKHIWDPQIPQTLREPTLFDSAGLPRYWALVWSMYEFADLASASKRKLLFHIEALYQFSESLFKPGTLDDALFSVDIEKLGEILEAYFISIRNLPNVNESAQIKWQTAYRFVNDIANRLSKSNLPISKLQQIKLRLDQLGTLYSQLRIGKKRTHDMLRALPSMVVEALYELLDPSASGNPFRDAKSRWRVFVIFSLLLHQGLRRGELLVLTSDSIKQGFDSKLNRDRFWLSVVENPYDVNDKRYCTPSIKTVNSIRQVPVSELTAKIVQEYVVNYRGKPSHSYLMNSQRGSPLSAETVTKIFQKISVSLPTSVIKDLKDRTGKTSISAHDLRHTCAVVRLNQLLNQGDSMDDALQKMRTFFGWARSSDMPRKYARAVFDDRLSTVWNNVFDDRIAILRAIPEHRV